MDLLIALKYEVLLFVISYLEELLSNIGFLELVPSEI